MKSETKTEINSQNKKPKQKIKINSQNKKPKQKAETKNEYNNPFFISAYKMAVLSNYTIIIRYL